MLIIQKVEQQIPEVFMAFTHTKKVKIGSFLKAKIRIRIRSQTSGSGSDQKGLDPDPQH
jgi:hypothetical protein